MPKWTYGTGGLIYSSPAIGADGTIYVGSDDTKLHAVNPDDGSRKWTYETVDFIYSSPAIGPNGTIYVGSMDNKLHAVNPDGSGKWTVQWPPYKTGGYIYSSPAIGADGTIYVGSMDNKLHAVDPDDGYRKWTYYETGDHIRSSPAIGADGTIYVGSYDNKLHAVNPDDGSRKWTYETGDKIRSSPAIGADGTVYVGSFDNKLHAVGLSAGHLTSSLHIAQRALARNASDDALANLTRLCNFSPTVHFVPQCNATRGCNVCGHCCNTYLLPWQCPLCVAQDCPPPTDFFTSTTSELVNKSCQLLNNTRNSPAYRRSWWGYLDTTLSFDFYKQRVSESGDMMVRLKDYEEQYRSFMDRERTLADRIKDANAAVGSLDADEDNWNARKEHDSAAMTAYGKEIVALGQQMDAKYALVQGDVHGVIDSLNARLKDLSTSLQQAKSADEARQRWSFFGAIFHVVKAVVSVASCFAASEATAGAALVACGKQNVNAVKGAYDSVKGCVATFRSSCEPCKQLVVEMQEAQEAEAEIDALAGLAKAARALNDQLSKGAPLSEELPLLISDKIAMDSLRTAADAFRQELVKEAGSSGQQFVSAIDDWTDMGVTRVDTFLSYYSLATRVQNDDASLEALQTRTSIVNEQLLKGELAEEAAVTAAALLVHEKRQKQADLVLKYMFEEWKQFHFFTLKPLEPLSVPPDPDSTWLLEQQKDIEDKYQDEIEAQGKAGVSAGWIKILVNKSAEPHTIAALAVNGTTQVSLPIPLINVTDPKTNVSSLVADTKFNNVRLFDVGVYPLDEQGKVLGGDQSVEMILTKAGTSLFLDSDMGLHTFTHGPVKYGADGTFTYQTSPDGSACPLAHRACLDKGLCSDYISYSPYGLWTVELCRGIDPKYCGVDMTKLAALQFEFQVTFGEDTSYPVSHNPRDFFGKHYPAYPQDKGRGRWQQNCPASDEPVITAS